MMKLLSQLLAVDQATPLARMGDGKISAGIAHGSGPLCSVSQGFVGKVSTMTCHDAPKLNMYRNKNTAATDALRS